MQSNGPNSTLINQKQAKSFLGYINWGYIIVLGVFQCMQYQSDKFMATLLTYVPLAVQVLVLAYSMFKLKGHMYALMDNVPRSMAIFYPND